MGETLCNYGKGITVNVRQENKALYGERVAGQGRVSAVRRINIGGAIAPLFCCFGIYCIDKTDLCAIYSIAKGVVYG